MTTPKPESAGLPTSWRDVYALVQDGNERVMSAVNGLDEKVVALRTDFTTHMLEHAREAGAGAERGRLFGIGKAGVAIIVSLCSAGASVIAILGTLT